MARVKPRQPVLRRGHPAARGLFAAYPLHERGGSVSRDVCSAYHVTGAPAWNIGPYGRHATFDGTNQLESTALAPFGNAFTVVTLFRATTGSTSSTILCHGFGSNDGFRVRLSGGVINVVRNGANNSLGLSYSEGVWYALAISGSYLSGTQTYRAWVLGNGTMRGGTASISVTATAQVGAVITLGNMTGQASGASNRFRGDIAFAALWNYALPDGAMRNLLTDVFQIVRPVPRTYSKTPSQILGLLLRRRREMYLR